MYMYISGFKSLEFQGFKDVVNVVYISTMYCKGKKARSRNEAAKFDWNVTGLETNVFNL